MKKINKLTILKYNFDSVPKSWSSKLPFKPEDLFVCLGEFKQVPGHGIMVNIKTGKLYCGYHIDEFREATDNEV